MQQGGLHGLAPQVLARVNPMGSVLCLISAFQGVCLGQEAAQLGQAIGEPAVASTAHCWLGNAN